MSAISRKASRWIVGVTLAIASLTAQVALAAPCVDFTDIDDTSAFCPNVEWLKNRKITLGCTSPTLFCPGAAVSRLAMAAFMNRLGSALTPEQLRVDTQPGIIDLNTSPVVCQTGDYAVVDFPRRAYVDVVFNGFSTAEVALAADLAISTNGGAAWTNLNTVQNRGAIPANLWGTLSDIGYVDLDVGQTVRFGVRMTRGGMPGINNPIDSRCQLRVLVYSRDGAASPY